MERIINDENNWDDNVKGATIYSPVDSVSIDDVVQTSNEMKTEKIHGPTEVSLELMLPAGK